MSSFAPCIPCCTTPQVVNVPGIAGAAGTGGAAGTNGVNAYTVTSADFVVPVTGNNVTLSVLSSVWNVIGQILIIGQGAGAVLANPGPMTAQVVSIPTGNTIQVKALGYAGDVVAGSTIGGGAGGALVSPSGLQLASPIGIAFGGTGQATALAAGRALGTRRRLIASLVGADFNSTGDQALTGPLPGKYLVQQVVATNASVNLTTAAGGIYTALAKGGIVIVPAAQVYTALTASGKFKSCTLDATGGGPTTDIMTAATLYLSLTTAQGAPATADVYVFGDDLS